MVEVMVSTAVQSRIWPNRSRKTRGAMDGSLEEYPATQSWKEHGSLNFLSNSWWCLDIEVFRLASNKTPPQISKGPSFTLDRLIERYTPNAIVVLNDGSVNRMQTSRSC